MKKRKYFVKVRMYSFLINDYFLFYLVVRSDDILRTLGDIVLTSNHLLMPVDFMLYSKSFERYLLKYSLHPLIHCDTIVISKYGLVFPK